MKLHYLAACGLLACGVAHAAPPTIASVHPVAASPTMPDVGVYEKLELLVDLRATFENPYDPDQVDLSAEFTAPSGKVWRIWGFYNPTFGSAEWMVRFSPTETGQWRYVVKVRDGEGAAESAPGKFSVTASEYNGFIHVATNKRFFQYFDGTSFYGIGMWYNDDGYGRAGRGGISEQGLDQLKGLGVNFISFFVTPLETRQTGLGRYDQDLAARLDQVFAWCEQRNLQISLNLLFHAFVSETVWGAGNTRYLASPYRDIAAAKDWYGSDEAWKYQKKLYRYMIARWGYSRALFLWFVIDEINGTDGWTEGGADRAEDWCRRMNQFFHDNDPYGRPTTGTQSGGIENWWPGGYQIFDVAARELYESQGHPMPTGKPDLVNANPLRASYGNYAKQVQNLWRGFEKPAIIGECGYDHTYYEPGTPGYIAMHHNALWASLANGAAATPFWWAYGFYLNESILTSQMRSFAGFVRDVDFAGQKWEPAEITMTHGDAYAMKSDAAVFGWVVNPVSGVAKESFTVSGLADGQYNLEFYRTWRGRWMPPRGVTASGGKLTASIPELTPQDTHAQNIGDDVAFRITTHDKTPQK